MQEPEPAPLVRTCTAGDLESILKIETESFPDPYGRETFELLLRSEQEWFLVAEGRSGVQGYVAGSARYGLIFSLAVSPGYRRKRIAWMLMDAVLRRLSGHAKTVSLQVRVSNSAAIELYRKLGFRRVGMLKRYYADGEDALVMSVNLQSGG